MLMPIMSTMPDDHPGHVEVGGLLRVDAGGHDDGNEAARGEHAQRPGVVAGEETPDLAVAGGLEVAGEQGVARNDAAEDEHIDERQGNDSGKHPRHVDAQMEREGRYEHHQQDDLDDAEDAVLHEHPGSCPQADQHAVLQGEDGPGHHGADEHRSGDRPIELRVGRTPPAGREHEKDRETDGAAALTA